MDEADKLLENPMVRLVGGLGLMLIAERAVVGLIVGMARLTGLFEGLVFDGIWNLPQAQWLAIAGVVAGWIVLGSIMKTDPVILGGAAGAFVFMSGLIANIRGDLPEIVRDLYDLLPPSLFLVGVAIGFLALLKAAPAVSENGSFMSTAPPPMGFTTAPEPAPAPTPAPAPEAAAPVTGRAAGWLPDPKGEAELRYWDGSAWTDHTHNG